MNWQTQTELARKEADELRSRVGLLERERDEWKSRTESGTGARESGLMEEAQTKMMNAHGCSSELSTIALIHR